MKQLYCTLLLLGAVLFGCQNEKVPQVQEDSQKQRGILVDMTKGNLETAEGVANEVETVQQQHSDSYDDVETE